MVMVAMHYTWLIFENILDHGSHVVIHELLDCTVNITFTKHQLLTIATEDERREMSGDGSQ